MQCAELAVTAYQPCIAVVATAGGVQYCAAVQLVHIVLCGVWCERVVVQLTAGDETGHGNLTQVGAFYSSFTSTSVSTVTRVAGTEVAIDCGQYSPTVDGSGITWLADTGFQLSPATTVYTTSASITPSTLTNAYLYQTFRSGPSNYSLPVSQAGSYAVTLLFAEPQYTSVGARVFSISVQGVRVNASFDIYRVAGAANKAIAVQYTAQVTTTTGLFVTIQLGTITSTPLIAGLLITPSPTTATPPPPTPLYIQMSANSGTTTDSNGHVWTNAGQFASGGTSAAAVSNSIVGAPAALQFVYQSNLWGAYTLWIPVAASGVWQMQLLFAETYVTHAHKTCDKAWWRLTCVSAYCSFFSCLFSRSLQVLDRCW